MEIKIKIKSLSSIEIEFTGETKDGWRMCDVFLERGIKFSSVCEEHNSTGQIKAKAHTD